MKPCMNTGAFFFLSVRKYTGEWQPLVTERTGVEMLALTLYSVLATLVCCYMAWDWTYGCPTRASFTLVQPILKLFKPTMLFVDIDHFGLVNDKHGYDGANAMVHSAINSLWAHRVVVFRYYSGDEFVIVIMRNRRSLYRLAADIEQAFAVAGLSVTGCVARDIDTATGAVQGMKPKGEARPLAGRIHVRM